MNLGGWTFAFSDYHDLNITTKLDSPQFNAMQRIIDPLCILVSFKILIRIYLFLSLDYLDRYANINLMLINSAGDEVNYF